MKLTSTFALAILCGVGFLTGCESGSSLSGNGLVGTWQGDSTMVTSKWGYGQGKRTIIVKDQQGTEFTGENTWSFKTDKVIPQSKLANTYDPATGIVNASKPLIGTYNPRNCEVHIVEVDGGGVYTGHMIDSDTMELVFTEPGAWARTFRTVLKRQPVTK